MNKRQSPYFLSDVQSVEDVEWGRLSLVSPPFIAKPQRRTGKRGQGVRYENKVHGYLRDRYGLGYIQSPWFQFRERRVDKLRWCQPDGLLLRPKLGVITLVEVKYQHTPKAWAQLVRLYLPVVQHVFGPLWRYATCEVVKWYDPAVSFPQRVTMAPDLFDVRPGEFGVHIWKP